jgi:hypothetical protein
LLWFAVTRYLTAEWLAQQLVEAFPWDTGPAYLVRDNDRSYGQVFLNRLRSMGIRDRPTAPRSPWQNPYAERLIGTLRRECLGHVLILGCVAQWPASFDGRTSMFALLRKSPKLRGNAASRVWDHTQTCEQVSPVSLYAHLQLRAPVGRLHTSSYKKVTTYQ